MARLWNAAAVLGGKHERKWGLLNFYTVNDWRLWKQYGAQPLSPCCSMVNGEVLNCHFCYGHRATDHLRYYFIWRPILLIVLLFRVLSSSIHRTFFEAQKDEVHKTKFPFPASINIKHELHSTLSSNTKAYGIKHVLTASLKSSTKQWNFYLIGNC